MTDPDREDPSPLGRVTAHRLALELFDAALDDVEAMAKAPALRVVSAQLLGAVGSISARIAEGYVRRSAADRARYYEYARGSAEEACDWYRGARTTLAAPTLRARYNTLTSIRRLLTTMIRNERDDGSDGFPHRG